MYQRPFGIMSDVEQLGVRRGRFWVTTDEESHAENEEQTTKLPEEQTKPTEVRRKGRFLVVTAPDDEFDDDQDTDNPTEEQYARGVSEPQLPYRDSEPQLYRRESAPIEVTETLKERAASESKLNQQKDLPPLPPPKTNGDKKQPPTVMFELQKISAQNRKLHSLLLSLCNEKEDQVEDLIPKRAPSPMISDGKIHVASVSSTSKLMELVSELTLKSNNVVTEYDALRSKNHLLEKQLKEVKQQLKESQQVVLNLKQELEKVSSN